MKRPDNPLPPDTPDVPRRPLTWQETAVLVLTFTAGLLAAGLLVILLVHLFG